MAINKILIVADSPTERLYLTDILVKNGFAVSTAVNGDEAIERILAGRPDLRVIHAVPPRPTADQPTRAIARDPELAALPVIICSSKNQETDRIWGLRQGAKDYLVKPVDPERLLASIAAVATGSVSA